VKFFTSAMAETIKFNLLSPKGNRIRQKNFDSVTGEEVQYADCGKGFEVSKDQFVRFSPSELKQLEAESSERAIAITEFVNADSIDPVQIEKTYYLGPDKGAARAFSLLSQTMTALGKVAVAQWASHGREHLVVIRPYRSGLVLHQMFYGSEIRPFDEIDLGSPEISSVERKMAERLVQTLDNKRDFDPSGYKDGYIARVQQAVDEKLAGGTFTVKPGEPSKVGPPIDLAELLEASLKGKAPSIPPATAPKKAPRQRQDRL
jgi:DNA end-binding protein Ku